MVIVREMFFHRDTYNNGDCKGNFFLKNTKSFYNNGDCIKAENGRLKSRPLVNKKKDIQDRYLWHW